ncbi:clasp N terminal-domain-containing protein [Aspergillus avenaceus]|uniref:Clasp N terminal-domain-containing protein n=1 Tax=Aspergillus avenaceus TaxID=36643 RepID=A0A5N6TRL0_ASPAV|nr:clasp N terminal-domain-containing protein [Aspergillus avenaceus]
MSVERFKLLLKDLYTAFSLHTPYLLNDLRIFITKAARLLSNYLRFFKKWTPKIFIKVVITALDVVRKSFDISSVHLTGLVDKLRWCIEPARLVISVALLYAANFLERIQLEIENSDAQKPEQATIEPADLVLETVPQAQQEQDQEPVESTEPVCNTVPQPQQEQEREPVESAEPVCNTVPQPQQEQDREQEQDQKLVESAEPVCNTVPQLQQEQDREQEQDQNLVEFTEPVCNTVPQLQQPEGGNNQSELDILEPIQAMVIDMESKATALVSILQNNNQTIDAKVSSLQSLKSEIKQRNVPEGAVQFIFQAVHIAIGSHNVPLYTSGFSTLGHLLKRLYLQDQSALVFTHARAILPVLYERLGDHRPPVRKMASQAFTDIWPVANVEVEQYVLERGLIGKNARAREMGVTWLLEMGRDHGLLFRAYVPTLVGCLEDADSLVRDAAKGACIGLFRTAKPNAKADLRKHLQHKDVRKSIVQEILSTIDQSFVDDTADTHTAVTTEPAHPPPLSAKELEQKDTHRPNVGRVHPNPRESDNVVPLDVLSGRDIERYLSQMAPHFEGRESEANWPEREKGVKLLRRLTRGNAPHDYNQIFISSLRTLVDGIMKVVNTPRTTLSTQGCLLLQDLAKTCGPTIDPMTEIIMQNMIKFCGGSKKISATKGNDTMCIILESVSYTPRMLQHVTSACQDKNAQLRQYAATWLRILLGRESTSSRSTSANNLDTLQKVIQKCLNDANPSVREEMRTTFWKFHELWPQLADDILNTLDSKSRLALERNPANRLGASVVPRPVTPKGPRSRLALKEAIALQKKSRLSPKKPTMPTRPASAQSALSQSRADEHSAILPKVRTNPPALPKSTLSSAPVRLGGKPRRPATAEPTNTVVENELQNNDGIERNSISQSHSTIETSDSSQTSINATVIVHGHSSNGDIPASGVQAPTDKDEDFNASGVRAPTKEKEEGGDLTATPKQTKQPKCAFIWGLEEGEGVLARILSPIDLNESPWKQRNPRSTHKMKTLRDPEAAMRRIEQATRCIRARSLDFYAFMDLRNLLNRIKLSNIKIPDDTFDSLIYSLVEELAISPYHGVLHYPDDWMIFKRDVVDTIFTAAYYFTEQFERHCTRVVVGCINARAYMPTKFSYWREMRDMACMFARLDIVDDIIPELVACAEKGPGGTPGTQDATNMSLYILNALLTYRAEREQALPRKLWMCIASIIPQLIMERPAETRKEVKALCLRLYKANSEADFWAFLGHPSDAVNRLIRVYIKTSK